jgi:hypothetical protein
LLSTTVSVSSGSRSATRKRWHRRRSYGLSIAMAWASLLSPEMSCAQASPGRTKVARACQTRRRATTGDTHKPAPLLANPQRADPLLTFMVRRESPVRVRKSLDYLQIRYFCCRGERAPGHDPITSHGARVGPRRIGLTRPGA